MYQCPCCGVLFFEGRRVRQDWQYSPELGECVWTFSEQSSYICLGCAQGERRGWRANPK